MKKIIFLLFLFSVTVVDAQHWKDVGEGVTGTNIFQDRIWDIYSDTVKHVLFVAGHFNQAGQINSPNFAKWDGVNWMYGGINSSTYIGSITSVNDSVYYAIGSTVHKSLTGYGLGLSLPSFNSQVNVVANVNGVLYAGGNFTMSGTTPVHCIAKWNGTSWEALGTGLGTETGLPSYVDVITEYQGKLVAGGMFIKAGLDTVNSIAMWDGTSWSAFGSGMQGNSAYNWDVYDLLADGNNLYAAGQFVGAGGITVNGIARWDGVTWHAMGNGAFANGTAQSVYNILKYQDTILAFGGFAQTFGLAKWNGVNWSSYHSEEITSNGFYLDDMTTFNNELYIAGSFILDTNNQVLNYIARSATVNLTWQDAICSTPCNGFATVADSVGVPPHNYMWSNGATTQTVTGLCVGTYSVTVTDASGSPSIGTVTIDAPPAIQIIPTITDASCGMCANGSINLSVTGGTGSYNMLWSTSDTTNAFNNLAYGNYAVTVTDSVGCSITDNYQLSYSNTIQTQSSIIKCYGECTGTASAAVNGIPPFTYQWNNSDTTAAISNLCASTYIITVTDSNGVVASDTVVINELSQINFQDTTTNSTCPTCTNGMATTTISGGTPPYHYNWSNGATTNTIDSLPAGTYYVTVTDDNNCVAVDTVAVGFDVGVSEQLSVNSNQLTVTPLNENNMAINISATSNTKAQLIIYNTQGQLISSKNITLHQGTNHFTEPTPTAQGMYLLQLQTAGEVRNVKFIRE